MRSLLLVLCALLLVAPSVHAQQIEGEGGGSSLTVKENDNNPTVSNVGSISFTNGSVTDNGGGGEPCELVGQRRVSV